ncbi:MAG: InlB B-repeat-containing protein, partial [Bacteroidales bacterium]|nr:InlB B-repeat-containing protein [Bacteroidales bacterium]
GSMAPQKAIKGEEFSISSNVFTRADYTFTGWNTAPDGSGTSYTDRQVVTLTEDITLYAQWDQRFYVSFEANGGTGEMEVQTFTSGEKKALLACTFANLGYLFSGWNTEADGSGTSYSDKQIISVTQDLTLYAQWKRGLYTVTFDANGGTGFMSAQTFEGGVSQALSTNVFTREGFLFDGWNTMADGSGTSYTDKEVISLTTDLTVYAQWTGYENGHEWVDLGLPSGLKWATCNIGATTPEGYGDYFAWGETEPKSNYAWDNYKFGSSIETFNKYNSTDKKTILEPEDDAAHVNWGGNWRMPLSQDFKELLNNCTSVWTKVGDVNGYKLTSKINGNSIFLPAAGYKYDWNWVFENSYAFYRAADKERDGHSYGILGTYGDIIEEETLWMREACSIRPILGTGASVTFNANGGMGTMSEQRFEEGVSQQLSPNTFTRAGYTFVGWNTAADGSGTSYTDMQEISLTRNTTLFAQWKPYHEYYVTFDANGGEGEMEPQLFLYGIRKPLMENSFTREDYVFVEWNLEPDGSGATYQDQELTSLQENITLYAQWREKVLKGIENGYEWVDLGLPSGLKWATCNVGATSPEGYGDYFAWGETSPKNNYDWSTYKYCKGSYGTMTKYCTDRSCGYNGFTDNKTTLELSDDAAHTNWGGKWRMPTITEQRELIENCTWTWTTQNGVNGYSVISKSNGNNIFLPAAGDRYGNLVFDVGSSSYYGSSSLYESYPDGAYGLYFASSNVDWSSYFRFEGLPVRAVCP